MKPSSPAQKRQGQLCQTSMFLLQMVFCCGHWALGEKGGMGNLLSLVYSFNDNHLFIPQANVCNWKSAQTVWRLAFICMRINREGFLCSCWMWGSVTMSRLRPLVCHGAFSPWVRYSRVRESSSFLSSAYPTGSEGVALKWQLGTFRSVWGSFF